VGDSSDILSDLNRGELVLEFEAPAASEKLDMTEAVAKIVRLERRVMWRKRLLSLQDALALAVMISGLIAAALVVLVRLGPITMPVVTVIIGAMILSFAPVLTRWLLTRTSERDAAFLIDESLKLD
jgi:hypothetical protein